MMGSQLLKIGLPLNFKSILFNNRRIDCSLEFLALFRMFLLVMFLFE